MLPTDSNDLVVSNLKLVSGKEHTEPICGFILLDWTLALTQASCTRIEPEIAASKNYTKKISMIKIYKKKKDK